MAQKPILVPSRLRRPPATGWSWVDRRFVREHMAYLSREAVLLYFFLSAVADKQGLSFYSDGTLVIQLRMTLPTLVEARDELLAQRPDCPRDSLGRRCSRYRRAASTVATSLAKD